MSAEVVSVPGFVPSCMSDDEWLGWLDMNRPLNKPADRPCADCPLGYAAEMRAIGRCNGTPAGVEEDTEMDQPKLMDPALSRGLSPTRRVTLDVNPPPCGSCAHEPVCALRTAVETMSTHETAAPSLPGGLRLTLVAGIECEHFLRDRAKPAPVRVLTSQERGQANGAAAYRKTTHEWTPEQRAAQGERMRARNLAAREGVATG